jgi:hypothetical protein
VVVAASDEDVPTPYRGVVYLFEIVSGQLVQQKKIYDFQEYASNLGFGASVAISGNYILLVATGLITFHHLGYIKAR